jgi:hypothetical protein
MLRRVALVRCDVSGERIASIISAERSKWLVLFNMMTETMSSSETSVITRATRRHIPEVGILHSHRRENLKSYTALADWPL